MKIVITLADKLVEAETKCKWSEMQLFYLASETAMDKKQDWEKVEMLKDGKAFITIKNPKFNL